MKTFADQLARALILAAAILGAGSANAVVTYLPPGPNTSNIPGLTGFATNGAMMDNLSVTATFSGGSSETVLWADTGATSGGVTGTGWSLSLTGDTFSATWNFAFAAGAGLGLESLFLDGRSSFTVFDRTDPSSGTPGSAQGADWACVSGPCDDAAVTYDYEVSVGAAAAVGDLWQTVFVDFVNSDLGGVALTESFGFRQDTDNDSRLNLVPEPGTLALLGIALGAIGFARRRVSVSG